MPPGAAPRRALRCAIYTRKSSEEGLEQAFNSLEAQREACAAYVASQAQEGWRLLPERYDDGGQSGGTLERPALQRLLEAVRARRLDVIVVYKIDRLTRALVDFAKLTELFEAHGVSFVTVTQQFNTTSSMGRLTLNVLLSFAQFEREVAGERIRDKIAASKRKGMWMGGVVPLGYEAKERTLAINPAEAEVVRTLFRLYLQLGNVRRLQAEADRLGLTTKVRSGADNQPSGGRPLSRGHLYAILRNPLSAGQIAHKGRRYPGRHPALIDSATWEAVQRQLAANRTGERTRTNAAAPTLLVRLVQDAQGHPFTPSHAIKAGRRYRYYVDRRLITGERGATPERLRRVPAGELEALVRDAVLALLAAPHRLLGALGGPLAAQEIEAALAAAQRLLRELQQAAPALLVARLRPLLRRVVIAEQAVRITLAATALRRSLGLSPAAPDQSAEDLHELVRPIRLGARGGQLKLVIGAPQGPSPAAPDAVLLKALARAHRWLGRLTSGEIATIQRLAEAEGVSRAYVSQGLQLAFLAPDIVEAILEGRQPVELTAKRLLRRPLPRSWSAQRRLLGLPA